MVVVIFQLKFKLGQILSPSHEEEHSVCAAVAEQEPPAPSRPGSIPAPWVPRGEGALSFAQLSQEEQGAVLPQHC